VLVEELQKIVRGQPPLSPAIARRLLTHFRGSGNDASAAPEPGLRAANAAATGTKPTTMNKPVDHERLTPRETEVLTFLSKGFPIKDRQPDGHQMVHRQRPHQSIYKKSTSSRAEAAVLASKQGLV
jgi:hypothetical protein